MKKFMALLLAVVMVMGLVACGAAAPAATEAASNDVAMQYVTADEAKELLVPIFYSGQLVYRVPDIQTTRAYCQRQVDALWDEVKRFENPHNYYVDLSQNLWDIKQDLLKSHGM